MSGLASTEDVVHPARQLGPLGPGDDLDPGRRVDLRRLDRGQVERHAQLPPDLAEATLVGPLEAGRVVLRDRGLHLDAGALRRPVQQLGVERVADATPARLRQRPRLDRRRARLRVPADEPDPGADVGAVVGGDEPGHVPGLLAPVLEVGRIRGVSGAQGVPDGEQTLEIRHVDVLHGDHGASVPRLERPHAEE